MDILHINTYQHGGGAGQLAYNLMEWCIAAGHRKWMAVRELTRMNPRAYCIDNDAHRQPWARFSIRQSA